MRSRKLIAVVAQDRVVVDHVRAVLRNHRADDGGIGEQLIVEQAVGDAVLIGLIQIRKLQPEQGRVQRIQTRVEPDHVVENGIRRGLAVVTEAPAAVGDLVVVRGDGATVA